MHQYRDSHIGLFFGVLQREPIFENVSDVSVADKARLEVCCSVLRCVAVCCSVLQCVAVCCSALRCNKSQKMRVVGDSTWCMVLQRVAVCCDVLQRVVVCCGATRHRK